MKMQTIDSVVAPAETVLQARPTPAVPEVGLAVRVRRMVAFRNSSALYLLVFMVVVFSIWVPDTFLTASTWRSLLS
ncbi:MAG: hypothetical protein ACR2M5_10065, partial [Nakamurella sp.]